MSVEIKIIKISAIQAAKEIRQRNHLTWKQLDKILPKLSFQVEEEEFEQFKKRVTESRATLWWRVENG